MMLGFVLRIIAPQLSSPGIKYWITFRPRAGSCVWRCSHGGIFHSMFSREPMARALGRAAFSLARETSTRVAIHRFP